MLWVRRLTQINGLYVNFQQMEITKKGFSRKRSTKKIHKKREPCEDLNVAFVEYVDTLSIKSNKNATTQPTKGKRGRKKTKSVHINAVTEESQLNTTFLCMDSSTELLEVDCSNLVTKRRSQRRLSGLFPAPLNTGFLIEDDLDDNENSENQCDNNTVTTKLAKDNILMQRRLRIRPIPNNNHSLSDEELISYYTNKNLNTKKTNLETISEVPTHRSWTGRKIKRSIDFSKRMSSIKLRKRHTKVVKCNLWQNLYPVSNDFFDRKLAEYGLMQYD